MKIKIPYFRKLKILKVVYFILFPIILLNSCTSLETIQIEVAVPPQIPIAEDIQSLALMNRCINQDFTNLTSEQLEEKLRENLKENHNEFNEYFQDRSASDTVLKVAADALFGSGRFDVVIPQERYIFRFDKDAIAKPLDISYVKSICKDFKVDAVLTLESFAEPLKTNYYSNRYASPDGTDSVFFSTKEFSATTDITHQSEWRLYRPDELKKVVRIQVVDSIFWRESDSSQPKVYAKMPKTKEALIYGGFANGYKLAELIAPKWENQERNYYKTGNKEIDAALILLKKNQWKEAAVIWMKFAEHPSKNIRSEVEFNLALADEMNGDLDHAMEWILKSIKTKRYQLSFDYLKILDHRRKVIKAEKSKNIF